MDGAGEVVAHDRPIDDLAEAVEGLPYRYAAASRGQGHVLVDDVVCAERHRGVHVSRKRVARLMRQAALSGLVRRRKGRPVNPMAVQLTATSTNGYQYNLAAATISGEPQR